jgi:hypothetical protein
MELVEGSIEAIIVHILSISRLPRLLQLNRIAVSPYVVMWLADENGAPTSEKIRWMHKVGCREPVWNSAHRLGPMRRQDVKKAKVKIEVWDYDPLLPHNLVGQVRPPLPLFLQPTFGPITQSVDCVSAFLYRPMPRSRHSCLTSTFQFPYRLQSLRCPPAHPTRMAMATLQT